MIKNSSGDERLQAADRRRARRAGRKPAAKHARTPSRIARRHAAAWFESRVRRLRRLLAGRLRLAGTGRDLRVVLDLAGPPNGAAMQPPAAGEAVSRSLPAIEPDDVPNLRSDLAAILDQHPASRALWPSLALIERALRKHGGAGVARLSAAVLKDAAKVLARLVDDWCPPGLVILHEHVRLVLRTVHGEDPSCRAAPAEHRFGPQVLDGSMSDFIAIDRLWDQRLAVDG